MNIPGNSFIYFNLFKIDEGEGRFIDTLYVYTQNTYGLLQDPRNFKTTFVQSEP